ncbi:MAG: peptide deformylase [Acidimicrobiales bacterium]|nr:peptide deformylase [Acidimicrobiales bacterium]MCB1251501.1 peptide deformylase [Acidimicrobiales bacterium]MCB1260974.1 peptide deformylase [Acidimicrobiales bacterium]
MATFDIRIIGDPVLKQVTRPITDIDGKLAQLATDMLDTMYAVPGIGLAAPQVGIQKRLFVYDLHDTPGVLINPEIVESDGEWTYSEGCLSIPGLYFEITRPDAVLVRGRDLDGNEIELEVDELWGRLMQHELDHLDGTLMVEHLSDPQRKAAKKRLRELMLDRTSGPTAVIRADGSVEVD